MGGAEGEGGSRSGRGCGEAEGQRKKAGLSGLAERGRKREVVFDDKTLRWKNGVRTRIKKKVEVERQRMTRG